MATALAVISLHVLVLVFVQLATSEPLPPFNLLCEKNLVGLSSEQSLFVTDNPSPRLSWTVAHSGRRVQQKAFRVRVGRDRKLSHILWDSGTISSQENSVKYVGPPLESGALYYWKVRWWDHEWKSAESEETGHFMMGILDPKLWENSKWIAPPYNVTNAPVFYQTLAVGPGKDITQATLFISGLGFFKVSVNGQDLNSRSDPPIALTPGWTNYEVRVPYVTYSVTEEVQQADQTVIEVILGIGWRNTSAYARHDSPPPTPDNFSRVLRLILNVTYSNGSSALFVSDEDWNCISSIYTYDSIYNGEIYNAPMQQDLSTSMKATVTDGPYGKMYLPAIPPIVEIGTETAIDIYRLRSDPDKQIVDFGNNCAGVCRLNVKDLPNLATVQIKHAEVTTHPPYGPTDGSLYYDNLRSALQTDIYTSDGVAETYQPTFTYHGFRYAEVSGYPRTLTTADITKVIIHSNLKPNGKLNTSNPLLNSIQDAVVRGQLSNLMSVPTDCDQRDERLGWMGDAGLSSDSMALNFHMEAFHPHYLQLIEDEQVNGSLPDVVPFCRYGNRPADPSWGAAFPQIIWVLYKYYGDLDTAAKFYPALQKYIEFMLAKISTSGIGNIYCYYGDWVPPPQYPKVDSSFTSAFSLLTNIKQAQEIATALGHSIDADLYQATFTQQSKSFNKAFFNTSTGMYLHGLQITYVLPLALDIVPSDMKDSVINSFLNHLTGSDNTHITAGIVGTKYLLPVLSQLNQTNLAMEIVEQVDYPSWGFMLMNPFEPATTIWELWNSFNGSSGMDSRNHHMFSSVSGWMMMDMVGLSMPEGSYGFNEIHFHPARTLDLSHASVSLENPKPISMSWQRNGGIQCAKSPEDRSSINPGLPKHNGLEVSCGKEGTIVQILFASFGNPTGHCGYHKRGGCHVEESITVVEKLCLGKNKCQVPTDADFWGDPCPGMTKWLSVAVQCQTEGTDKPDYKFSSIQADVSVPVGSKGTVFLPAYGKRQLKVWESDELMWGEGRMVGAVEGVLSAQWIPRSDALKVDLASGSYSFMMCGEASERKCLDSKKEGGALWLHCNSTQVINSVSWASYGSPEAERGCFSHARGECHAGSSKRAVEMACVGKQHCKISVNDRVFGRLHCRHAKGKNRLIVEYTCN